MEVTDTDTAELKAASHVILGTQLHLRGFHPAHMSDESSPQQLPCHQKSMPPPHRRHDEHQHETPEAPPPSFCCEREAAKEYHFKTEMSTSIKNSLDHEAKDESQAAQAELVNYKAVQL